MKTIFRLTAEVAYAPFVDGAKVETVELGHYSTLDAAMSWVRSEQYRELFDPNEPDERVLIIDAIEHTLNTGHLDFRSRVALDADGQLLGPTESYDLKEPWGGRDPSTCRRRAGDIVACVESHQYRTGVVLAQPPSPEWIRQCDWMEITRDDDVYLVGFRGDDFDHSHPREWEIFEPLDPVPAQLLGELGRRFEEYRD